jgi:hypothetical protein
VGLSRICRNLLSLVINVAATILLQQPIRTGLKNIGHNIGQIARGATEIVPVVGNLAVYYVDRLRIRMIEAQINSETQVEKPGTRNYYANGVVVTHGTNDLSYDEEISFMCQGGARFRFA